ncbi:hypothetical protein jhhlp_003958 [Lomentospora prolificans]|uniref:DNA polymerase n=1 Tax=Lomentospora prolificans TaxID=41688 RepID=A0A2N3NA91_9PEZI|nr:hypothetical protein jhhlp_003958 [Lomentospora prolificans]
MDLFKVRINCIDHYQATPTRYDPQLRNDIRSSEVPKGPKVPVIRVFGSTETGQKVCAHIHGAFPYLFIEYNGSLEQDAVGTYMYRLHMSIDYALAVSYRRDQSSENAKFVARITLVKGVPFYGFHVGYRYFLKIYVFNPIVISRLADLLLQGVIMKQTFQPYETHLQYLLQFMCDYNLYGCDYLESTKTHFRAPVPEQIPGDSIAHQWNAQTIPADDVTDSLELPRLSHCSIEVDICVQDIKNRKAVKERRLHHDFIERVRPTAPDLKLLSSMDGLWRDETRRRKLKMPGGKTNGSPFPLDALVSMSADPRDSQPQGWIHEEEYRGLLQQLIAGEKSTDESGVEPTFETFVEPDPKGDEIRTVLQSVTDLYPENLRAALGFAESASQAPDTHGDDVEIDAQIIRPAEPTDEDYFPQDSDEELVTEVMPGQNHTPHQDDSVGKPSKALAQGIELSVLGVCPSALKTGRTAHIPIIGQLLSVAKDEQFMSKDASDESEMDSRSSSKRSRTPDPTDIRIKRAKIEEPLPKVAVHGPKPPILSQTSQSISRGIAKKKPNRSPVSSQSKEQSNLNFPIVKDPHDQGSHFNLGQPSQKLVEPAVHTKEDAVVGSNRTSQTTQASDSARGKQVRFGLESKDSGFSVSRTTPSRLDKSTGSLSNSTGSESISTSNRSSNQLLLRAEPPSSRWAQVLPTLPPSAFQVCTSMKDFGLPDVVYQDAFYSNEKDVPTRPIEFAGREFRLEGNTVPFLPAFNPSGPAGSPLNQAHNHADPAKHLTDAQRRRVCTLRSWEPAQPPPTYHEVKSWWQERVNRRYEQQANVSKHGIFKSTQPSKIMSQIDGPTQMNKNGFKYSQKQKSSGVVHETQYMNTMSVEIHVNTRGKFVPNPEEDEVQCIFWSVKSDEAGDEDGGQFRCGIVVLSEDGSVADMVRRMMQTEAVDVVEETTELDLLVRMVEIVRTHDPDILTGYEVHGGSWGYLIERARLKYDYDLCDEFSRMKSNSHGRFGRENDRWGFNTTSTIRVTGRHMINVWRAMRGELNLLQYTPENVAWHLLHRRVPHYPWKVLTSWYKNGRPRDLFKLLRHYLARTKMNLEILDANELIARTSEQARVLGVDFFSVFSRGSQFKVESIMFRIAKPENYLFVSPSRKQVGSQNALECLPLVMEPQSAFYNSPLLVLDFQSLYPSVMIAYNYCYSTFLGRIVNWRGTNKMGFTNYHRQHGLLELLKDHINIAPNGIMYVKAEIRKSLLSKMLTEILETRFMVKSGMKQDKDDRRLQRLLNNRQLALKLLANVTYGYTSASYSGRMPCSEIADSIVQTGRETLERAIAYIHSREDWGAEVVYGDTDSLFVYLKGRTKDQAFDLGAEIAKAITDMNPRPVKLKFEKVYFPCVLLAKKRYVGYKYESRDQLVPEFDAKGIETVRRDGTPAEQKIEEKALKILFETADLSQVKAYFQSQCDKIMRGAVSVQDFCFAKEVKLGGYSEKGPPPPGALISARRMLEDARAEPQYGERVPYVVITGAPGARLIDRCVAPEDLLENSHVTLDAEYYITKNITPPLDRIFNLVGASARQWYDDMPKVRRIHRLDPSSHRKTLESYMSSASCVACGAKTRASDEPLCDACGSNTAASLGVLERRLAKLQQGVMDVDSICRSCAGLGPLEEVLCDSKDCPVYYTRVKEGVRLRAERAVVDPVIERLLREPARLEW